MAELLIDVIYVPCRFLMQLPAYYCTEPVLRPLQYLLLRCCFVPPSVRNLRSLFWHFQRFSPVFSWISSHFQSISVMLNHFQSITLSHSQSLELGQKNRMTLLKTRRWGKPRLHALSFFLSFSRHDFRVVDTQTAIPSTDTLLNHSRDCRTAAI